MKQQLSLSARPKTLDELVGQAKLVSAIRGHEKSGRRVKCWLFCGPRGTGKTTVARILALSYQCTHQLQFGTPCQACRKARATFPINEINAADVTGIDRMRTLLEGSDYGILGDGAYRVYILDELHQLSSSGQNLLLKYLEDSPDTTVFILCSTAPQKIIETLRSRCVVYELRELEPAQVEVLVTKLLKKAACDLPADRLADALNERAVRSPRLIAMAVEKYAAGLDPDDAAQVEGSTSVDVRSLTKAVTKGDWPAVATALQNSQALDVRAVRLNVIAYLRSVLLESTDISERTKVVALALTNICGLSNAEDLVVSAGLAAELYKCTAMFSKYRV